MSEKPTKIYLEINSVHYVYNKMIIDSYEVIIASYNKTSNLKYDSPLINIGKNNNLT